MVENLKKNLQDLDAGVCKLYCKVFRKFVVYVMAILQKNYFLILHTTTKSLGNNPFPENSLNQVWLWIYS